MLRHVIATEGVQGAYAGLAPTMIMSIPNYLLYLLSYDELVDGMRSHTNLSETSIPLAGGAIARLLATSATAPFELLRTRHASSQLSQNQGVSHVWTELRTIVQTEGVPALYRGITPQLLRDVPFAALYMLCLEKIRGTTRPFLLPEDNNNINNINNIHDNQLHHTPQREMGAEFINAATAGMIAASCTAPLDVIKTRFQSHQSGVAKHKSIQEVFLSIIRREGLAGLWRGNQARMMKVAPQYAIMMSVYEVGKKALAYHPECSDRTINEKHRKSPTTHTLSAQRQC
jgi:hypothetical protein